ncbi:hypothetical protein KIW84_075898 [Lathyrus oleraceus]|uniref:PB1-like domain-containing protein n=1 Tax=Pisum sativum TaxID=3888 RepID=A0A9D5A2L0_PEA|nr:hypothetical protein KIW84_075898 [Pisum sativum]
MGLPKVQTPDNDGMAMTSEIWNIHSMRLCFKRKQHNASEKNPNPMELVRGHSFRIMNAVFLGILLQNGNIGRIYRLQFTLLDCLLLWSLFGKINAMVLARFVAWLWLLDQDLVAAFGFEILLLNWRDRRMNWSLQGDNESSYGGSVAEVKCDVDKWGYFEVLGIVKELGYEESGKIIYNDPIVGLFTLSDDKCAQEMVDLCKVHKSVHLYVQHSVSQPDYYDGPIEDETDNIAKVVVNVDETEDIIGKLVGDVLNGKEDSVSDLNKAEVGGTNVVVNGVWHMSDGEVEDINVDVNGDENMSEDNNVDVNRAGDMSDSDDVSFQCGSALDVAFQESDEDNSIEDYSWAVLPYLDYEFAFIPGKFLLPLTPFEKEVLDNLRIPPSILHPCAWGFV